MEAIRTNSRAIISLNFLNESIFMIANAVFAFAYLLAPIALVLLAESYQPLFALAIGILMTVFFPKVISEKIHIKHLLQKGFAILLTGLGTYLLFHP
jgi:hypothetical protein